MSKTLFKELFISNVPTLNFLVHKSGNFKNLTAVYPIFILDAFVLGLFPPFLDHIVRNASFIKILHT